MAKNLYLLLGLPDGFAFAQVKKQYLSVLKLLSAEEQLYTDVNMQRRVRKARERLSQTYEAFKNADMRKAYTGEFDREQTFGHRTVAPSSRPKIGQLLVAAGLISMEQLDEVLEIQLASSPHMPLGRILVSWKYLSQADLDYYLMLQDIIKLAPRDPKRLSQQLIELGLISEDQLAIARLDQKNFNISLGDALVRRRWLSQELADGLSYRTMLPSPLPLATTA
jgi:hypothetical protein